MIDLKNQSKIISHIYSLFFFFILIIDINACYFFQKKKNLKID